MSEPMSSASGRPTADGAAMVVTTPGALPRGYVTAWAVVGAMSAGYLAFAAWDGLGGAGAARGEIGTKVAQLTNDVSALKSKVAGLSDAQVVDRARVAALESSVETRLGGLASSAAKVSAAPEASTVAAASPAAQPPTSAPPAAKSVSVPGVMLVTTKNAPPAPPPAPKPQANATAVAPPADAVAQPRQPTKIIAAAPTTDTPVAVAEVAQPKAAARQKTAAVAKAADAYRPGGSSPAAAIETGSLPARASTGPIGLEVASSGSLDAARQSWGGIAARAGDALAGAEPRILPSVDGTAFRVIAGPYASEADAQKACAALKSRGVACRSTGFGGAPL